MRYGVVFEQSENGVAAYLPAIPGLAVVGDDQFDALALLDEALQWHIEGMLEDGDALPLETEDLQNYAWHVMPQRMFIAKVLAGSEYLRIADGTTAAASCNVIAQDQSLREESSMGTLELLNIA